MGSRRSRHRVHKLDQLCRIAATQQHVTRAMFCRQASSGHDGVVAVYVRNDEQKIDTLYQAGESLRSAPDHVPSMELKVIAGRRRRTGEHAFGSMQPTDESNSQRMPGR